MAAEASFNTEMLRFRLGLLGNLVVQLHLPKSEVSPNPRISTLDSAPGVPPVFCTRIPGRRPAKAFEILATGAWMISSAPIAATAPVRFTFFCVP